MCIYQNKLVKPGHSQANSLFVNAHFCTLTTSEDEIILGDKCLVPNHIKKINQVSIYSVVASSH